LNEWEVKIKMPITDKLVLTSAIATIKMASCAYPKIKEECKKGDFKCTLKKLGVCSTELADLFKELPL